uniref:Matrix protein n=1 Tax=Bat paramyxovirus TaxID=1300978 RepID=A0A0D3MCK9_9MONO|nr:matrix protein [Bat paramyxovirus]
MSSRQGKIPIPLNDSHEDNTLPAFPIVLTGKDGSNGKGKLAKQLRIKNLMPVGSTESPISFVNTYGFIRPLMTYTDFYSETLPQVQTPCLTACMIPFGAGPNLSDPGQILKEVEKVQIIVRKSASVREEVVFDVRSVPALFSNHWIWNERIICVSSERFVKTPSKLIAGTDYSYSISFVSVTFCPESYKFRVPRPLQRVRAKFMRSVLLEIILELECREDSPLRKQFAVDASSNKCVASLWIHVFNMYKNRKPFRDYDDAYFNTKCKSMNLICGIADIWGPTIIVQARGKIPAMARQYFNHKGWACHPISSSVPNLSKTLWSVGAQIKEVNAVLQASDLTQLVKTNDIISPKIKIQTQANEYPRSIWSPFKKRA